MSDLLGEALARADNAPHYDLGWQIDPYSADTIVAAARNWHTLNTVGITDEMVERAALAQFIDADEIQMAWVRRMLEAALTDTADE